MIRAFGVIKFRYSQLLNVIRYEICFVLLDPNALIIFSLVDKIVSLLVLVIEKIELVKPDANPI